MREVKGIFGGIVGFVSEYVSRNSQQIERIKGFMGRPLWSPF